MKTKIMTEAEKSKLLKTGDFSPYVIRMVEQAEARELIQEIVDIHGITFDQALLLVREKMLMSLSVTAMVPCPFYRPYCKCVIKLSGTCELRACMMDIARHL